MKDSQKKYFIAGAVCPKCQQIDTIVIDKTEQYRECVECDFQENKTENKKSAESVVQWIKKPKMID